MIRSWEFAGRSGVDVPLVVVGQAVSEHLARQTAQTYGVDGFLPLARRAELADTLRQHLQACASTPSRPRVLVVEDYPETLTLLRRILESRYAVDTAEDGAQALALWQPGRYDLVLLDIMLPRVSGPEVLDRIRLEAPAQPVVIMTANSTLELAELMLLRGATDFVSKPFRAEELRRICELALKHRDYWAITRELDGALPAGASPAAC